MLAYLTPVAGEAVVVPGTEYETRPGSSPEHERLAARRGNDPLPVSGLASDARTDVRRLVSASSWELSERATFRCCFCASSSDCLRVADRRRDCSLFTAWVSGGGMDAVVGDREVNSDLEG